MCNRNLHVLLQHWNHLPVLYRYFPLPHLPTQLRTCQTLDLINETQSGLNDPFTLPKHAPTLWFSCMVPRNHDILIKCTTTLELHAATGPLHTPPPNNKHAGNDVSSARLQHGFNDPPPRPKHAPILCLPCIVPTLYCRTKKCKQWCANTVGLRSTLVPCGCAKATGIHTAEEDISILTTDARMYTLTHDR